MRISASKPAFLKEIQMDMISAIENRISCRAFEQKPLEPGIFEQLEEELKRINDESGFNFQLYGPDSDSHVIMMNKAMFANDPACYAALVGKKDPIEEEKLGYYGERFILFATSLGLGTCWVASTYDKATTRVHLEDGEVLHDVVPIGYPPAKMPMKQRTIRKTIRAKSKKPSKMFEGPKPLNESPAWIQACLDAVGLAPSAVNEQPVVFTWEGEGSPVIAKIPNIRTRMEYQDLGIAKYHFEAVAHECGIDGSWEWGDGGAFNIE